MVTVAIAGGSGGVGRTIVDAIKASNKHKAIILGRKAPDSVDPSTPTIAVDYTNIDALTTILEENKVDVVISALKILTPDAGQAEVNLAKAADKASTVARFIASNWGLDWGTPLPAEQQLPLHALRLTILSELQKLKNIEWTRFNNGFFLDYYGLPHIPSYMGPHDFVLDIKNKAAAIPGTGDEPLSLTYTKDVGKFVVAALDLDKWDETFWIYGDTTTWNQFVEGLEDATGSKFNVTYDSVEKLSAGEVTDLPSHANGEMEFPLAVVRNIHAKFGLYVVKGLFLVDESKALNKRFPEIETVKVKDILELWKGN